MTSKFDAGTACVTFSAETKSFNRSIKSFDGQLAQQANSLGRTFNANYIAGADFSGIGKEFSTTFSKAFSVNKSAEKSGKKTGESFTAAFGKQIKGKLAGGAASLAISTPVIAAEAVDNALEYANAIKKASDEIGIGSAAYQDFANVARQVGISQDQLNTALKTGGRNIQEFLSRGTGSAARGLKALGLEQDITSGKLANSEDIMLAAFQQLEKISDESKRAAVAQTIFGKEGGDNLKLALNKGVGSIDEMITKSRQLGQVLDEDAIVKAAEAKAAMRELGATIKTNLNAGLVELAPLIEAASNQLIKFVRAANLFVRLEFAKKKDAFEFIAPPRFDSRERLVQDRKNAVLALEKAKKELAKLGSQESIQPISFVGLGDAFKVNTKIADENKKIETIDAELAKRRNKDTRLSDPPTKDAFKSRIDQVEAFKAEFQRVTAFPEFASFQGNLDNLLDLEGAKFFSPEDRAKLRQAGDESLSVIETEINRLKSKISGIPNLEVPDEFFANTNSNVASTSSPVETVESNSELEDAQNAVRDSLKAALDRFNTGKALAESARTAMGVFRAELEQIAALENDPLIALGAGGAETFSRLRIDKLEELGARTGDYKIALSELIDLTQSGQILPDDFGNAFKSLSENIDGLRLAGDALERLKTLSDAGEISPQAFLAATNAIKQASDYQDDLTQAEQEYIAELVREREELIKLAEAEIARALARGDDTAVEAAQERIRLLKEEQSLLQLGIPEGEAETLAPKIVENEELADLQNRVSNTLSGAFRAAMNGNFDGFLQSKLQNAAASMFDQALDSLLNSLFSALGNLSIGGGPGGQAGGLFGSLATIFAGFFADGGTIPRGQFGIVGEAGPELAFAGSAPVSIVPFDPVTPGRRSVADLSGGGRVNNSSVVMNIQTPDARSFRKSQATIESDMALAQRRAARDL